MDDNTGQRLARFHARLALAAAALTFVVIVASAFMRHAQAGLSCADWPACYALLAAPDADAATPVGVHLARIAHRLAATAVLALILGQVLLAFTQRPVWRREGALALAALAIAAALAILGIVTPGARLPAITLGNLLGGYAMLAVLAAAWSVASPANGPSPAARRLAAVALALVFAQAFLGGMIGAQYGSLACPSLPGCAGWSWDRLWTGGALDPLRPLAVADGRVVTVAGVAGVHVLHRLCGVAVALFALAAALRLRRDRPRLAWSIGTVVVVALALGMAAVSPQPALAVVVAHNASAAALVALLAAGVAGTGRDLAHAR